MARVAHLRYATRECQCAACREYFASPTGFDQHRREGRCLTPKELREKGMVRNGKRQWTVEREPAEVQEG